eukprot:CAMPEP_0196574958 /NCGR_PEP_ID=MMETSP1081-20130531/4548_1 /TAXON_ID=36882 /ORGANISM="Pyramimonas amylifera, Strain CCMP720" /LENGTH=566 /DNA_ID=CAMNT_0041893121 /DNA_START=128 /DNA_END=1828 /DNA_ORIENTATION=-
MSVSVEMSVPDGFDIVKEGQASILHLKDANDVFYNKAQVVNRDLSVVALRVFQQVRAEEVAAEAGKRQRHRKGPHPALLAYPDLAHRLGLMPPSEAPVLQGEGGTEEVKVDAGAGAEVAPTPANREESPAVAAPLKILEGLAASGLRALRYAKEVPDVGIVVANDCDAAAVEAIRKNVQHNGEGARVWPMEADARVLMLQTEKVFDVVDLDPYGSPAMFLDSALQSVSDGGLLCCTATDMAVLCGNNKEACWQKYGCFPLRAKACHEMALRILLASIEQHANRYKRHIVPLLSVSVDFYVRVFVRVYTAPEQAKWSATKLSYCYQCVGCESLHTQALARACPTRDKKGVRFMPGLAPSVEAKCGQCGWDFNMGGPFWMAPLHDQDFTKRLLGSLEADKDRYGGYGKVHGLLTAVGEELNDVPLFMTIHSMSATLKCTPPPANLFRSALINAGYRASTAHCNPLAMKTNAPMDVMWDIMRCWVKEHPVKNIDKKTPGGVILSKEPKLQANFARSTKALSQAQLNKVARFPQNPEENWGPKARATGKTKRPIEDHDIEVQGSSKLIKN